MRIGAADKAELEWIGSQLRLQCQAILQCGTRIFEGIVLRTIGQPAYGHLVPGLVIREFVIRREHGVRFAVTFHLRYLVEWFPTGTLFRPGLGEGLAGKRAQREHHAATHIAVVRNGEHLTTGLGFIGLQRLPELLRVLAVQCRERQDLAHTFSAVPIDDNAMQVVGLIITGVFIA